MIAQLMIYIPYYPVSYMIKWNDDQKNLTPDCIAFLHRIWCILENPPVGYPDRDELLRNVSSFVEAYRECYAFFLVGVCTSDHLSSCEGFPNEMRFLGHKIFLRGSDRLSVMAVGELCSVMVDELL